MTLNSNQARIKKYFQHSSQLAAMDNHQIAALLDNSATPYTGWGRHQTVEIEGSKLFLKRVPLTALEEQNNFSTENLYLLPTFYHYGLGSAGTGVYREVVAHIKTTNWVLSGECANFPLLYHYRVIPFQGERTPMDLEWHQQYVRRWANNEAIGNFMLERANAKLEMILFLEYIPHVLQPWLLAHQEQTEWVLEELYTIFDFLHKKGFIHFDAHFYNMLTDDQRIYLTDFGLVLDQNFSLRKEEAAFFNTHREYDYGYFISNLVFPIYDLYEALPAQEQRDLRIKYGIPEEGNQFQKLLSVLFENIEEIQTSGVIHVHKTYLAQLIKYRPILALMSSFYSEMWLNPRKDTPFPSETLRRLLDKVR